MAHRKTLTVEQVDLLRWIDRGCPAGVMSGTGHRVSAAALVRRRLVTTTGHGDTWTAQITEDGRDYLRLMHQPSPPRPRQGNRSVTAELVDDIVSAGGSIVVERGPDGDGVDYERRARLAEQHGKLPEGKRLSVSPAEQGRVRIELVNGPTADERGSITVPGRIGRLHPVVRAFRDAADHQRLSRATVSRAVRLLHALAVGAESQGMSVTAPPAANRLARNAHRPVSLIVELDGHHQGLQIFEEGIPSHGYADRWRSAGPYPSDHGARARYEAHATGQLTIELIEGLRAGGGRAGSWGDRKSWRLDDKLADVLWEIRLRVGEEQERARQAESAAATERRAWEAAMQDARTAHLRQHRVDQLVGQLNAWALAERIRSYCDVLAAGATTDAGLRSWIAWSLEYANSIDPASTLLWLPSGPRRADTDSPRTVPRGMERVRTGPPSSLPVLTAPHEAVEEDAASSTATATSGGLPHERSIIQCRRPAIIRLGERRASKRRPRRTARSPTS